MDGISFDVLPGETVGIVGESGSGKSVTSLALMRLLPAGGRVVSGDILWQGSSLLQLPEQAMRRKRGRELAMIFQEPMTSLNPVFRCGYQVAEAIRWHMGVSKAEAREQVLHLFEQVKLPSPERMYRSFPHELSGGQKQRVMIAMALSCQPQLLIADEPTTALDVTVQRAILDLIAEIQAERQLAVMFITHDLGVVADIAHKVVVMYRGNIVEQGETTDIFRQAQHPYTRGLLACRPPTAVRWKRLPTVRDFMIEQDNQLLPTDNPPAPIIISEEASAERLQQLQAKEALLRVRDLCTWFPGARTVMGTTKEWIKAVDGVSFTVHRGETLGLVGESGCGKTTLGRTVMRLVNATSGDMFYGDTDLRALRGEQLRQFRRKMQIVFQDPYASLNPRMTIGKAIQEPMEVHKLHASTAVRAARTRELLERVGLSADMTNRYPHEFSGGQRQRICIARALALEPEFIICDESVSALDVSVQAQVLNLLQDLQDEFGLTYIFISHDLSVVHHMADRILVMHQGRVVEQGSAHQVFHHPTAPYTRQLVDAIPGKGELRV